MLNTGLKQALMHQKFKYELKMIEKSEEINTIEYSLTGFSSKNFSQRIILHNSDDSKCMQLFAIFRSFWNIIKHKFIQWHRSIRNSIFCF